MSQATLPGRYRNSNLFSGYYLDERVFGLDEWDCDAEAEQAFEELQTLYEAEGDTLESYDEDPLRRHWIDEVLSILGYESLPETPILDARGSIDRALYDSADERRHAAAMKADGEYAGIYGQSLSVLEAKQWDADFTERFGEARSYRDASHQIKYYLEHTPESVSWGILTNGKKWRLYGTKDYETETYYEVDLVDLLESDSVEVFKYFYVFFRPAAFRESSGTTFLDTVWSESETAAQELGEDLQDNVFTALRVLGEGFVATNGLDIDPADDQRLAALKEHSLVLLYRLMFVLYAESRGLIDPDDPDSAREYEENFSLDALRREVIDEVGERADEADFEREFSSYATRMWGQLENLFALVDSGNDELGIPAYNGGLFDEDSHRFLAANEVSDRHLAEVIYRLSTTETDEGHVAADYADLDTRHLGTIYEGLLEHEFAVAPEAQAAVAGDGGQVWKPADEVSVAEAVETVEEGELYVVNDDGERKATGAYYTPDYVVTYIIEETVGPLLDDIEEELDGLEPGTEEYVIAFWERVTDLKILDPAMGSGHFLTKATGYLADAVMERVRELESGSLFDEELVRRTISRECIYGVDVNGMAVELAKLSMWLETLAADQPLAFLDHHLKAGNSLVGSDITEVLADEDEPGQVTLAYDFAQTRRRALGQVMDRMGELLAIDNETLDDVHSMEDLYAEIREDPLYEHLQAMATVHTAGEFGLDVPEDAIERMARAIEDEGEWADIEASDWFRTAQAMADEEGFFHWELEFPAVFFDGDGERLASAGFDAVVGNPPYVKIQNIRQTNSRLAEYATEQYRTATGRFDLYALFTEQGSKLARSGHLGYILPNKFFESGAGEGLRTFLTDTKRLDKIIDFGQGQVFEGATTYTCLLFLSGSESLEYGEVIKSSALEQTLPDVELGEIPSDELDEAGWILTGPIEREAIQKMQSSGVTVDERTEYLSEGIVSGDNDVLFVEVEEWDDDQHIIRSRANDETYAVESEIVRPLVDGDKIERYGGIETDLAVIYPYRATDDNSEEMPEKRLESNYPKVYSYLSEFRERLENRGSESMNYPMWYSLWCPRTKQLFESAKLIVPDVCQRSEFTLDKNGGIHLPNSAYGVVPEENHNRNRRYLLAVLNSSLTWFYIYHTSPVLRGDFRRFMTSYLAPVPLPDEVPKQSITDERKEEFLELSEEHAQSSAISTVEQPADFLAHLAGEMYETHSQRRNLNLDLLDYLGNYEDGPTLGEFYQPASGLAESVLTDTAADSEFEKLRVTGAQVERDGDRLRVLAVPYVKPENPEEYETNGRGYATLDPVPAMEFVGLSEAKADLIAAFVPHAVDEAGGFAGYRDNATATISPLDRLEGLTLPKLADVEGGIERYMDARERAAEFDEKIERTDELIDEIVYELYGLTDEEIEIVEGAVGG
ncbi:Eco57I restriction-modification methylase domain-containing protein [Halococcus sp. AFM35]|uniref:Eco57I restriction-modification methylase domain-containing protein n=1 Tax=Halococcus sp. AFM35 TaxID=3421653 RepID=UPI003EBADB22